MRELNIEQRLNQLDENVAAIKRMLEELLNKQAIQSLDKENNEIMSVKQVAQFLGLDPNIIYTKCSKGDIPYFKIGKQYRFKRQDIIKWIGEQKELPTFSVDDYVNKYMQTHQLKG